MVGWHHQCNSPGLEAQFQHAGEKRGVAGLLLGSCRCRHGLSNSDSETEAPKSELTSFPFLWQEDQTAELGQRHLGKDGDGNIDFWPPLGAAVVPGPALARSFLGSSYTIYPTFNFGFLCPLNVSESSDRVARSE